MFIERVVGIGWGRLLLGVLAAGVAASAAFSVGMLLLAALRRQGWVAYALGGVLGGGGLLFGLAGWPHWQEPLYLLGAILGRAGALAFRAVWRPLINPAQSPRP